MAARGPAHGTSMGSMQALNTSSSVSGATTWFLSQRMSLRHSIQNHGSAGGGGALKTMWSVCKKENPVQRGAGLTQGHADPVHEAPGTVHLTRIENLHSAPWWLEEEMFPHHGERQREEDRRDEAFQPDPHESQ
ncbi:hypothetical protein EYF80_051339 [Liparis tanakae]|uniref:Uncharacterized protein n=1 Tax=Liparis tanakae TaxID=230148 RepID=A0A4Z2FC74_9TELE|nr:hypothetical protein EYF80_051339 [Liparis tanakae]